MMIVSGLAGYPAAAAVLGLAASGDTFSIIQGDTTPHEEESKQILSSSDRGPNGMRLRLLR
ncbi:MAG: hypothetical protein KJ630_22615 [Proteobacteria bacterium]|nr:hypothetical protein [Pseudomonadota bacterium]